MMTYYITTDASGQLAGLYSDEAGYAAPPVDAIAVTDDDGELLRRGFHRYKLFNGAVVENAEAGDEIARRLEKAVHEHLSAAAKAKGYDDIVSACSYAAAPNPYQAESQAFVTWRGEVWSKCYEILADAKAGNRVMPDEAGLVAELPECRV